LLAGVAAWGVAASLSPAAGGLEQAASMNRLAARQAVLRTRVMVLGFQGRPDQAERALL
jgi:hypothetical protein